MDEINKEADLRYYREVIGRRRYHIFVPAVAVFALAVAVAFLLPPIYKSTATILIEAQEIPQEIVRTTVTGYVEERLQMISQVVLGRARLLEIIDRFGLYEDLKERETSEEIVDRMRGDIQMEPIQAEVIDPRSGRPGSATIAFTLSYEGEDPGKVVQVANTVASLYLEENLKNREEKARTTSEFLEKQMDDLREKTASIEEEIAKFKGAHTGEMPELMQLNLQTMERVERDIATAEKQIQMLADRRIYLQGQLATLEPQVRAVSLDGRRVLTPREQLEALETDYLALRSTLSDDHPDVVAMRKKVEAMRGEVDGPQDLRQRRSELSDKEAQLALLSKKFSAGHPDVVKLRKEVEVLREDVRDMAAKQAALDVTSDHPENPSYINLQTQITSTEMEIENGRRQLAQLKAQYDAYRARVERTPQVEQAYRALERDYLNAQAKYQETMNRLLAAREATGLEESRVAEKFTLVDPPIRPEKPYKPNRLAILLIGLVLGAGAGIGFGSVTEYMDQSVRDPGELARITGKPVLAVIPYWETLQERVRRRRKRWLAAGGAVAAICLILGAVHWFYSPLDVLWIRVLRKLNLG